MQTKGLYYRQYALARKEYTNYMWQRAEGRPFEVLHVACRAT